MSKTIKTPGCEPAPVPLAPEEIDAVGGGTTSGAAATCGPIVLINGQLTAGRIDGPIRLPF